MTPAASMMAASCASALARLPCASLRAIAALLPACCPSVRLRSRHSRPTHGCPAACSEQKLTAEWTPVMQVGARHPGIGWAHCRTFVAAACAAQGGQRVGSPGQAASCSAGSAWLAFTPARPPVSKPFAASPRAGASDPRVPQQLHHLLHGARGAARLCLHPPDHDVVSTARQLRYCCWCARHGPPPAAALPLLLRAALVCRDDHDIVDGWGSYDPDIQNCPVMLVRQHRMRAPRPSTVSLPRLLPALLRPVVLPSAVALFSWMQCRLVGSMLPHPIHFAFWPHPVPRCTRRAMHPLLAAAEHVPGGAPLLPAVPAPHHRRIQRQGPGVPAERRQARAARAGVPQGLLLNDGGTCCLLLGLSGLGA